VLIDVLKYSMCILNLKEYVCTLNAHHMCHHRHSKCHNYTTAEVCDLANNQVLITRWWGGHCMH